VKEDAITWGDLDSYVIAVEKSAEVIVIRGNELLTEIAEVSQTDEGLNIESRLNSIGRHS
jgi:hypothetical protein